MTRDSLEKYVDSGVFSQRELMKGSVKNDKV